MGKGDDAGGDAKAAVSAINAHKSALTKMRENVKLLLDALVACEGHCDVLAKEAAKGNAAKAAEAKKALDKASSRAKQMQDMTNNAATTGQKSAEAVDRYMRS